MPGGYLVGIISFLVSRFAATLRGRLARTLLFLVALTACTSSRDDESARKLSGSVARVESPLGSSSGWSSLSDVPGVDGIVYAIVRGPSNVLYVGGSFPTAGGVFANNVARWDGQRWSALGSGTNGPVRAFAFDSSGNVYVAGEFTSAGGVPARHVAKWNGNAWSALGSGMSGGQITRVLALAVDNAGVLHAAGDFTSAGGVPANMIAKWTGSQWAPLGTGLNNFAYALLKDASGNLVVGGAFSQAGGLSAPNVARWNGTVWSAVGNTSVLPVIEGLALHPASGDIAAVGGRNAYRWNGSVWSGVGSLPTTSSLTAVAFDDAGTIYAAGGMLQTTGGGGLVVRQNGNSWALFGSSSGPDETLPSRYYYAIATDATGKVYVGGNIHDSDSTSARGIATWSGSAWVSVGPGIDDTVMAIAVDGDTVYAAGDFQSLPDGTRGGGPVVAKRTGGTWSIIGTAGGEIHALTVDSNGNLYAGGHFGGINGVTVNNVAKWDGNVWSALGGGRDTVYALAVDAMGNLYTGGEGGFAGWNGQFWFGFPNGPSGTVYALAVKGTDIYVGGYWQGVGLSHWNGTAWTGPHYNNTTITEIAVDASDNVFIVAGGLLMWDAAAGAWSPPFANATVADPNTLIGGIGDIELDPAGRLHLAGRFDAVNGVPANNIARWDGETWHPVGGGTNGLVNVLAFDTRGDLYAGGMFSGADTVVSSRIAFFDAPAVGGMGGMGGAGTAGTGNAAGAGGQSGSAGRGGSGGSATAGSGNIAGMGGAGTGPGGSGGNATAGSTSVAGSGGNGPDDPGGAGGESSGGEAGATDGGAGGTGGSVAGASGAGVAGVSGAGAAGLSGAGGSSAGAGGSSVAGSAGANAGAPAGGGDPDSDESCGCRTAGAPSQPFAAAWIVVLGACLRLRRRNPSAHL